MRFQIPSGSLRLVIPRPRPKGTECSQLSTDVVGGGLRTESLDPVPRF